MALHRNHSCLEETTGDRVSEIVGDAFFPQSREQRENFAKNKSKVFVGNALDVAYTAFAARREMSDIGASALSPALKHLRSRIETLTKIRDESDNETQRRRIRTHLRWLRRWGLKIQEEIGRRK